MELAPTIRSQIEKFMKEQGYKLQRFSELCGVNVGTLSGVITGKRPLSVNQLDKITEAMGLRRGNFYEQFAMENFMESEPHWRRIAPFLNRCAELGMFECIKFVVIRVTDNRDYNSELFEMAEKWYTMGWDKASLILFECVAESEKYQHSERLALCQYRIFLIKRTVNQHDNLNVVVNFEPYVEKLNEEIQLDAIKDIANVYISLQLYDKSFELAKQLERKADIQMKFQSPSCKTEERYSVYPLFMYKAYANLIKAGICESRGEYSRALEYTDVYVEVVRGVENPTAEELKHVNQFMEWAEANRYLYHLMMGKVDVIEPYLDYLEANPDEILIAFVHIVQAANDHSFNIDFALERFEPYIRNFHTDQRIKGTYTEPILNQKCIRFNYQLAKYRLNQKKFKVGFQLLLLSLQISVSCQDDFMSIQCIDLYGKFREKASADQEQMYTMLISQLNQSKIGIGIC